MRPYYEHGGITIFHGDCREVLPTLPKADLVLTDPPYGIADVWGGGRGGGWDRARDMEPLRNSWDGSPMDEATLRDVRGSGVEAVIWGGNHFPSLPTSRGWLVWCKPERGFSLSEAELAWTSRDTVIRIFDGNRSDQGRQHPTQKPLRLMLWCLSLFPKARTVTDPFMGSGTTLVAAKQLGRRCIGIELEEKYCEIAARRLEQETLPFFAAEPEPTPEPVSLFDTEAA